MKTFDETQSYSEGWLATTVSGSVYFPEEWMQIERFDEMEVFKNDWEAVAFVTQKAAEGSQYHRDALIMIEKSNFNLVNGEMK